MANVTIQQTENQYTSNRSTWTFVVSGVNIVASGATFVYTSPTITATYSGTSKGYASTNIEYLTPGALSIGDTEYAMPTNYNLTSWASGATKTLTKVGANHSVTLNTSSYFNTANPTQRIINLSSAGTRFFADSGADKNGDTRYNSFESYINVNNYATLTLNAPPIIDNTKNTVSAISFSPSNYDIYTGITRATISIDNLSAQYGGTITNVTFKIGNQTTSRSNAGTLDIDLSASGSFTPEVIFTDSRGQINTRYLDEITVLPYECSVSTLSATRVNSTTFKKEDEGTCAVLKATFTHTHFTGSTLLQPDVVITDITTPNITWYQGWDELTGVFSNQVTNWSNLSGNVDLYGKITNTFAKNNSYTITVTPKTTLNTTGGAPLDTTLAQSFYLLVGRPGGHGLGIGIKPPTDALYIGMDTYIQDNEGLLKLIFDIMHPVGSYYETSDSAFDPNDTWGGTWLLDSAGRFTVGYDGLNSAFDTIGETGGSSDAIVPYHTHSTVTGGAWAFENRALGARTGTTANVRAVSGVTTATDDLYKISNNSYTTAQNMTIGITHSGHTHTVNPAGTNGNATNANLPPYVVVYRWHRTA